MTRILAINGSARKRKGFTQMMLEPFLLGMREAGAETELIFASDYKINPCLGGFQCWFDKVGVCTHQDDMVSQVMPRMREADILVLGIPVYIPLPGAMQNLINRMCPLIEPALVFRDGRTRARMHKDVRIKRFVLVSVGGWWEVENMDTVVRVVEELALDSSVEFSGAILRPHASYLKVDETSGPKVLEMTKEAGRQLVAKGRMDPRVLREISKPLVPREEYMGQQNEMYAQARDSPKGLW